MKRTLLVQKLAQLVGEDVLTITQLEDAWPTLATVKVDGAVVPIALFMGTIGLSHRQRDHIERRFQNPASRKPILLPNGRVPLLAGLWLEDAHSDVSRPVVMVADAVRRQGRATRFSVFTKLNTLQTAAHHGWGEHENTAEETIRCFRPDLFPVYVDMVKSDAFLSQHEMIKVADAAGIGSLDEDSPAERARRVSSRLVRDREFGRRVLAAYGKKCAMCGLNHGLVQGAHIYPVAAPNSVDEVWNGFALCNNHHTAFDRHLIWVNPLNRSIKLHRELTDAVATSKASKAFVETTHSTLAEPADVGDRPTDSVFAERYDYFSGQYRWVG